EGVEECDDGNDVETDACLSTCKAATCGDMVVHEGVEECDDGNAVDDDGCSNACKAAKCGDGIKQMGEECDDGNAVAGDGCSPTCTSEFHAQCSLPYSTLSLADRSVNFNDGNGGIEYCDRANSNVSPDWSGNGWYRFSGQAGTKMPEAPPPIYACGTDAPGWLNGTHPAILDGVVNRQACFHWSGNTCNWSTQIQVVNCGEFYLYNLVEPTACYLRYCGAP
ncbi:MAG TPA: DUF4215 domain-containing protein, partial [Nannocystis sp.]